MYDFPREPLGIGQQLDQAIRLTRYVFPKILGVLVVMMMVGALNGLAWRSLEEQAAELSASSFIVVFLFAVTSMFLYFLLIVRIIDAAFGRGDSGDSVMTAVKKLPALILLYICMSLVLMGGLLLLIVPGLILMISLSLCIYVLVVEDRGPIDSLKRSHSLIWGGNWWRTAAVITVVSIIMMVLLFLVGAIFVIPASVADQQTAEMMTIIVNALITPLIYPFFFAAGLIILNDVRIRNEGADLEAQIADL